MSATPIVALRGVSKSFGTLDDTTPVLADVDLIVLPGEKAAGPVVHLRLLPGAIEDYEALVAGR